MKITTVLLTSNYIHTVHVKRYSVHVCIKSIILLGSRDGSLVIALVPTNLARVQFWLGAIYCTCMWVEFIVSSCFVLKVFLRVLWFSSLHKNQISKIQYDQIEDLPENQLGLMDVPSKCCKFISFYLFIKNIILG